MAKRKYSNDLEFSEPPSKSLSNLDKSNNYHVKLRKAIDNSIIKTKSSLFDRLPEEILEHICSLLPIKSLTVLQELNCRRISDSALKTNFINFSSCNDIRVEDIEKIFCVERSQYVRKINFHHMYLLNTSTVLKATIKCKHLSYLSVIGCGFQLKEIQQVLLKCKQLEELHWDVIRRDSVKLNRLDTSPVKIKHLYLHLSDLDNLPIVCHLIQRSQSATSILINTSTLQDSTFLVLNQIVSHCWYKLHSNLSCPTKVLMNFSSRQTLNLSERIGQKDACCPDNDNVLTLTMTTPSLQLLTRAKDFELLDKIESKTLREIFLCVTDKEFLDRNMDKLKHVMGKHTKLLSMYELEEKKEDMNNASDIPMSNLLERLVWNCCNIAHLIIPNAHFDKFKFETLHVLTGLKTLSLPSCVFCHFGEGRSPRVKFLKRKQRESFELLVKTCKKVQNFTLAGCWTCKSGPCDTDLDAISQWVHLQSLSLSRLKHMHFCPFLINLPHDCRQLKSLQLLGIGSGLLCPNLPNVIHVLYYALKLKFLSVNLDTTQLKSSKFWQAITCCKTLQGICMVSISRSSLCAKLIVDAVKECPCLHLFHFHSPNVPESLKGKIRRAMKSHGVKQTQVAVSQDERFRDFDFRPCAYPHFSVNSC